MASKNAGRLAGLAALAGAAYLATRDKDKPKDKPKDSAKPDVKAPPADRDDSERVIGSREPIEDERPAPTGMGEATKFATPAKVTRSLKAPSASVAKTPAPSAPDPRDAESGRNTRGRPPGMENIPTPAPYSNEGRSVPKPEAAQRNDGGKSMVDRQDAGAKRAGLSVADYYASGKQKIDEQDGTFKRGGKVKKMASGGSTSSASKRADGIAVKGKTRGRVL